MQKKVNFSTPELVSAAIPGCALAFAIFREHQKNA